MLFLILIRNRLVYVYEVEQWYIGALGSVCDEVSPDLKLQWTEFGMYPKHSYNLNLVQKTRFSVSTFVEKFCEVTVWDIFACQSISFLSLNYWSCLTCFLKEKTIGCLRAHDFLGLPEFKSCHDSTRGRVVSGSWNVNYLIIIMDSHMVCLQPVGVLTRCAKFALFVSIQICEPQCKPLDHQ